MSIEFIADEFMRKVYMSADISQHDLKALRDELVRTLKDFEVDWLARCRIELELCKEIKKNVEEDRKEIERYPYVAEAVPEYKTWRSQINAQIQALEKAIQDELAFQKQIEEAIKGGKCDMCDRILTGESDKDAGVCLECDEHRCGNCGEEFDVEYKICGCGNIKNHDPADLLADRRSGK